MVQRDVSSSLPLGVFAKARETKRLCTETELLSRGFVFTVLSFIFPFRTKCTQEGGGTEDKTYK